MAAALALAAACASGCVASAAAGRLGGDAEITVLFIGNSLTYANDLPGALTDLARGNGVRIRTRDVSFADASLEDHARVGEAMRTIRHGGWTYVVLQQGPSSTEAHREHLERWTEYFDDSIRAAGARTALFMVWPAVRDFDTMDGTIESYTLAADRIQAVLLPVGTAWRDVYTQEPGVRLYAGDGVHPSPLGTYLAALVIYERLAGRAPEHLPGSIEVAGTRLRVQGADARALLAASRRADATAPGSPGP